MKSDDSASAKGVAGAADKDEKAVPDKQLENAAETEFEDEEDGDRPVPEIAPSSLLEGLAQLWRYPWKGLSGSSAILDSLASDATLASWHESIAALQSALQSFEAASDNIMGADAYQLEYTRLFIGSFKMYAPPYASYYVDGEGQVYGPTTVEIENLFAQFGIELSEDEHDMPDHLRFLIAFLAMLAKTYEQKGNAEFAYAYEDFKGDYMLPWMKPFTANVNEYAEFPFFKELIAFTREVI